MGDASEKQRVGIRGDEWCELVFKLKKHFLLVSGGKPVIDKVVATNENGQMPGKSCSWREFRERDVDRRESR